jgi:electron transport complex protein RnfC
LPQQLYWHARAASYDDAQDYDLFDCIECGCCAHVCPSHIPLVQYFRHAKTAIWALEKQQRASDIARERHEARLARLERIKQERAEQLARKKQALTDEEAGDTARQAAIQAALERVRLKKEQSDTAPRNTDNLTPEQLRQIEEADQRRRNKSKPQDSA